MVRSKINERSPGFTSELRSCLAIGFLQPHDTVGPFPSPTHHFLITEGHVCILCFLNYAEHQSSTDKPPSPANRKPLPSIILFCTFLANLSVCFSLLSFLVLSVVQDCPCCPAGDPLLRHAPSPSLTLSGL